MQINRRQSLLGLSVLAGHALFPGVLDSFAKIAAGSGGGSSFEKLRTNGMPDTWRPELFSPVQGAVLADVVETIVPETGTPGAKAARVHVFVDLALKRCATSDQQRSAVAAMDALGAAFATLPAAERESRLKALDSATFALLRDLTLLGYFTSEVGATQALAYVAVPGEYRGCIDLAPGQNAWAT